MRTRALAALAIGALALALAACGDGVTAEPVATPTSGSRLVTMWLGYDDGARQLRRQQVFDGFDRHSLTREAGLILNPPEVRDRRRNLQAPEIGALEPDAVVGRGWLE